MIFFQCVEDFGKILICDLISRPSLQNVHLFPGKWLQLSNDEGETGHKILMDFTFDLPAGISEDEFLELEAKLEGYNKILDKEVEFIKVIFIFLKSNAFIVSFD